MIAADSGEIQTVVAARRLRMSRSVFIGVGRPSTAAILARMVHNPGLVLVYESGAIGAKPFRIPLSIGDGLLAQYRQQLIRGGDRRPHLGGAPLQVTIVRNHDHGVGGAGF